MSQNVRQLAHFSSPRHAEALKELDEKEFLALLEHRTGGLLGRLELESQRFVFPVQLTQSDRKTDFWDVWNWIAIAKVELSLPMA